MAKVDRVMLDLLKGELVFLEQRSYVRSVGTAGLAKAALQDSETCINHYEPVRTSTCSECRLMHFVAHEHHLEKIPCHFIALNEAGETVGRLEAQGNQAGLEATLKDWLRAKIMQIEGETQSNVSKPSMV